VLYAEAGGAINVMNCIIKGLSSTNPSLKTDGKRDNARNNVRCTQARKTTHGQGGQQDVDRTPRGRVSQNDRDKWRKYVHGVANPRTEDD